LIKQKIEILSYFLDRKKAFEIPSLFRLKSILPPNVEKLRIVELKDLDKQACGGTHVKNTSEIGEMKILKLENRGKNNRRLYFTLV
jgi:misacylated tRNA(Ala) deacylase